MKLHIKNLPKVKVPLEYKRDSDLLSISIPLFYSETGYSVHFDNISEFNTSKFKEILVKGAVWSAISILTNTDLGDKGIPIYFHVEDLVWDLVVPELINEYHVPEDWIRKTSFEKYEPEYIHPDEGSPTLSKKFGVFLDREIDTKYKMVFDADAFVYKTKGDHKLEWYDIFENLSENDCGFQFYGGYPITDLEMTNWLCTGLAIEGLPDNANQETIQTKEKECYERLGLECLKERKRCGNAVFFMPNDDQIVSFLEKNIQKIYQDEAVCTMMLGAKGFERFQVSHLRDVGIDMLGWIRDDDFENYSNKSRIVHLSGFVLSYEKWFHSFKSGIDGRYINNDYRLFRGNRKRIHIFPVAHNLVSPEFSPCAFAQKARKLAIMCKYMDHHVTFYGNELDQDHVHCDEFVVTSTEADLVETYGDFRDQSDFYQFREDDYNSSINREKIIHNYRKRNQELDILCYTFPHQQRALYDRLLPEFGSSLHIESGIGHYQPYMHYKVFETHSHRQYTYGEAGARYSLWEEIPEDDRPIRDINTNFHYGIPQWQDSVICNSWGVDEFDYNPNKGGDYLLFIGRIVVGKGVEIAMRVASVLNKKLIVAGQGDFVKELGFEPWDCVELVGMVGPEKRRELFYNCEAVLAPTTYLDVLCGVVLEAGAAGRPVVGPNFGGPSEVIEHKITGYQCRSFCHYVRATANVDKIEPSDCRNNFLQKYTNEVIAERYDEYFDHITRYAKNSSSIYWYYDLSRGIDF